MFKGTAEIHIKDVNTLETKRVIKKNNSITLMALHNLFYNESRSYSTTFSASSWKNSGGNCLIGSRINSGSTGNPSGHIVIGKVNPETIINEATFNIREAQHDGFYLKTFNIDGENQPVLFEDFANKTWELTFKGRRLPPDSGQREINLIGLMEQSNTRSGASYPGFCVVLDQPCIQTDQEVLDVFYRVSIIANEKNPEDYLWKSLYASRLYPFAYSDFVDGDFIGTSSNTNNGVNGRILRGYGKLPQRKTVRNTSTGSSRARVTSNKNFTQMSGIFSYSYDLNDNVGSTYSSFYYYTTINPYGGILENNTNQNTHAFTHQIFPSNINPVQSIFKHSSNAIRPYLDPSFLGASTSNILVDGNNYNLDSPTLYRLLFTKGGNIGEAEYKLLKRTNMGFVDNEYDNEVYSGKFIHSLPSTTTNETTSVERAIVRQEGDGITVGGEDLLHYKRGLLDFSIFPNFQRYDKNHIICADSFGLSILNVYTDDYVNFDQYSNPQLNTSELMDFCVTSDGIIWVATKDRGLNKIDIVNSTVTQVTINHSDINEDICYSVDFKNNGDVWAVFEGGVASSSDGGSSWEVYNESSQEQFSIPNITDVNEWFKIHGIVIDKEHPDDRLLIVLKNSDNIWWWSRENSNPSSNAIDSGVLVDWDTAVENGRIKTNEQAFAIRKWIKHFPNTESFVLLNNRTGNSRVGYYSSYKTIEFYSTELKATRNFTSSRQFLMTKSLPFEYNSNGELSLICTRIDGWATSNFVNVLHMLNDDLVDVDTINISRPNGGIINIGESSFSGARASNMNIEYMSNGIMLANKDHYMLLYHCFSSSDPFGGDLKLLIWDEYGWNGTEWELNNDNSKVTHTAENDLLDGVKLAFEPQGVPNIVENEYADIHVFRGIHKDNATTVSFDIPYHIRPTLDLNILQNNIIPSQPKGLIENKTLDFNTTVDVSEGTAQDLYQVHGMAGCIAYSTGITRVAGSEIVFEGDFSVSFKTNVIGTDHNSARATFGVCPINELSSIGSWFDIPYLFWFNRSEYQACRGNLLDGTCPIDHTNINSSNDVYTLERIGNQIFYKINGDVINVENGVSTDPMVAVITFRYETFRTFFDMNIDYYTENRLIVEMGNQADQTGCFDPRFATIESWLNPATCSIKINGTDAPLNRLSYDDPLPGQATLIPKSGWLAFNSTDSGSNIEAKYQAMYKISAD